MNLLEEYPLVPAYPDCGPHHVLIHWSHSKQHEVIVSKTERDLLVVLQSLMVDRNEWENLKEIRWYYRAHIIDPPNQASLLWAESQYEIELQDFKFWLDGEIATFKEGHGKLPAVFTPCPLYENPTKWYEVDDKEEYAWIHEDNCENHTGCVNCDGHKAIPVAPWTWNTLFEHLRVEFRKDGRGCQTTATPRPRTDNGDEDQDQIHVATLDAGHHRLGVEVVSLERFLDKRSRSIKQPVLFFFKGEGQPYPESVNVLLNEIETKRKAEEKKGRIEGEARHQAREKSRLDDATGLFGRLDTLMLLKSHD